MKEQLYLTFSLGQHRYSIDSRYLEEMLPLPEITMLPTASKDIIGILNLRGTVIPVLDLNLSLGRTPLPYRTTDSIIVLHQAQLTVGLIVSNIGALETRQTIDVDNSDARLQAQREGVQRQQLIAGKILSVEVTSAEKDDSLCWVLNEPKQWLRYVEIQQLVSIAGILEDDPTALPEELTRLESTTFCPEATPEERAIFQQRSYSLRQPVESSQPTTVSTLAVIAINGHYFGVDLSIIKEFTDIQTVVPIPCCPSYIVGNMNLRGDILTLVDLQKALSDSPSVISPSTDLLVDKLKVMVIEIDQYVIGILVDTVLEAMFPLDQREAIASSGFSSPIDQRYLRGTFPYDDTTVGILDLPKVLNEGNLVINEVVR